MSKESSQEFNAGNFSHAVPDCSIHTCAVGSDLGRWNVVLGDGVGAAGASGIDGTDGLGGGGGGGRDVSRLPADGGDGVVIVRYLTPSSGARPGPGLAFGMMGKMGA